MRWIEKQIEEDYKWDLEIHKLNALRAYKELYEKNPHHDLLRFARINTRGLWIFKRDELKINPELANEFYEKYKPQYEPFPIPFESYDKDMRKALEGE